MPDCHVRYLTTKTTRLWQKAGRLYRAMTLQPSAKPPTPQSGGKDAEMSYVFSSSRDRNDPTADVRIHNVHAPRTTRREDSVPIVDQSPVQLENKGRFLHIGGGGIGGTEPKPPSEDGSTTVAKSGVNHESGFNVAVAIAKKPGAVPFMIHRVNLSQVHAL